jgi:DNA polymerase III epsilon subunit-like protein
MHNLPRSDALSAARRLWAQRPVFIDTETTGLDDLAEIVEICVLDSDGTILIDTLVRPTCSIPYTAVLVHGISNEMVRSAPTWLEVWPAVWLALKGRQIGTYNADFDMRMLKQSNRSCTLGWDLAPASFFCIMKLYSQFCGLRKWQTLEAAARQCRLGLPNAHRARADALLARAVLEYMADAGT